MKKVPCLFSAVTVLFLGAVVSTSPAPPPGPPGPAKEDGRRLFEKETFGGNGRTCRTCHTSDTGTVSPQDAQKRFKKDPDDPLFLHDGSDDGNGHGVRRMLKDATVLVPVPLAPNVRLADDLTATSVTVARGIPTTLNTPALDPVFMLDGRQPSLEAQAMGAIHDHAQATNFPTAAQLEQIKAFELTKQFFSSPELSHFASGGRAPDLPAGHTASEKRGRRFFEDVVDFVDLKHGLCAGCHAGPMLNETNLFAQLVFNIPRGTRFQDILVSEFNVANNPVREYVFNKGTKTERHVWSPDIGRSAITGVSDLEDIATFSNFNAFKIPQLRGIRHTAPYFHDNSAKTLEDVLVHYDKFFDATSGGAIELTAQDQKDIVAYMKLLD